MRRAACFAVILALSACIPIPIHVRTRKNTTTVSAAAITGLVQQVRAALARVRKDVPLIRKRLRTIPCGSRECYSSAEVEEAVTRIRERVRAAFPEEAFASRISLDAEIAQMAKLTQPIARAQVYLVRNPPDYERRDVDSLFAGILASIDRYLAHDDLAPTLQVNSTPDGVTVEIRLGPERRETVTNNRMSYVWRGRYVVSASRSGFRTPPATTVDLINDDGKTLRCELVPDRAPRSAVSYCRLEP